MSFASPIDDPETADLPGEAGHRDAGILRRIEVARMDLDALRAEYLRVFGRATSWTNDDKIRLCIMTELRRRDGL